MSCPIDGTEKESVSTLHSDWNLPFRLLYFLMLRKGTAIRGYAHEKVCACGCNRFRRAFRTFRSGCAYLSSFLWRAEPGNRKRRAGAPLPLLERRLGMRLGSWPLLEPSPLGFWRLGSQPLLEPSPLGFALVVLISRWNGPSGGRFSLRLAAFHQSDPLHFQPAAQESSPECRLR